MTTVRRRAFFTYAALRGHRIGRYWREARAELRPARGALAEERLGALLRHCRTAVPYYARVAPAERQASPFEDIRGWPLLTKAVIRAEFDALKSNDLGKRRTYENTSGGSTGEPIRLVQDWEYADRSSAIAMALYARMGYEFGERQYRLWGNEQEVVRGSVGAKAKFWSWVYNTTTFNAFHMSPATMRDYLRRIAERPPRLLVCYAQALYELAGFAESNGIEVTPPGAITASAGTLYPFMRERIERVFGCPVYNWYGSREVGVIATQLPDEPLLLVPPNAQYVEIVDEGGEPVPPGVEGDIVVTCLTNFAMPLVRYRIGDRGVLDDPRADGVQRLRRVAGRNVDVFRRRDGTLVDGEFFTHLVYFRPWVKRFQFVQDAFEHVTLFVVKDDGADAARMAADIDDIRTQVRAALGPACVLDVRVVDDIPPAPSGKFRYTIGLPATESPR